MKCLVFRNFLQISFSVQFIFGLGDALSLMACIITRVTALRRHLVMKRPSKQSQNVKRDLLVTSFLRNSEMAYIHD